MLGVQSLCGIGTLGAARSLRVLVGFGFAPAGAIPLSSTTTRVPAQVYVAAVE